MKTESFALAHNRRLWAGVSLAVVLTGCADLLTDAAGKPKPTVAATNNVPGRAGEKTRPEEGPFATLTASAPSSAGFYLDKDGAMVVVVVDPAEDTRAVAAVRQMVATKALSVRRVGPVKVQKGKYTFSQLALVRDSIFSTLLGKRGVGSLDIDEVNNRVTIGVLESEGGLSLAPELSRAIAAMGLDSGAVRYRANEAHRSEVASTSLKTNWDTLVAGIGALAWDWRTGNQGNCTIGFVTSLSGTPGFVTASHCSKTFMGTDYSSIAQYASRYAASETNDGGAWDCFGNRCKYSDASFWQLGYSGTGLPSRIGLIAKPSTGTNVDTLDAYYVITSASSSGIVGGTTVYHVGQSTGEESGYIVNTCVDIIHTGGGLYPAYIVGCTNEATYGSAGGNSGGPVFIKVEEGNHVQLIGTHSSSDGTYRAFSQYNQIVSDLGGTLVTAMAPSLSAPTVAGSVTSGSPLVTWSSVSGANMYYVYRAWFNHGNQTGSSGYEYVGSTSNTSFPDWSINASAYNGSTAPGPHQYGYVAYYVYAKDGVPVWGPHSTTKYWVLAP